MPAGDVWQPPEWSGAPATWAPEPRRRAPVGLIVGLVLVAALIGLGLLAVVVAPHGVSQSSGVVALDTAESQRTVVEEGVAADGRSYVVSVSQRGSSLCTYLTVTETDGGGGGGGGCGSPPDHPFSFGGEGGVTGLTTPGVARVDLTAAGRTVTLTTKAVPKAFGRDRYFWTLLPRGVRPTRLVARSAEGRVLWRRDL